MHTNQGEITPLKPGDQIYVYESNTGGCIIQIERHAERHVHPLLFDHNHVSRSIPSNINTAETAVRLMAEAAGLEIRTLVGRGFSRVYRLTK